MQERQVTIAGETHKVPDPFVVMATQNPIETEGTYALPEAQVDRFMMKVLVDYPTEEEEFVIVQRVTGQARTGARPVATTAQLAALQAECRTKRLCGPLPAAVRRQAGGPRAIPPSMASRRPGRFITCGASPRATINLAEGARALAMLRGRNYVLPEDMTDLTPTCCATAWCAVLRGAVEGLDRPDAPIQRIMAKIIRRQDRPLRRPSGLSWHHATSIARQA